jgi:hypothetical protein
VPAGSWAARTRGKPHPIAEPASWLDTPWALRLLGETLLRKASTAEAEQAEFLALCEAAIGARVFLCVCSYGCADPIFRPLLPSHSSPLASSSPGPSRVDWNSRGSPRQFRTPTSG